jgi:iron complex transport system ATP-binding protein
VLVAGVDLSLADGEFVALVGPNGAGKTTLLRLGLGLLSPTEGELVLDGQPMGALTPRERAARVAWLPQHSPLQEALRAEEVVASARYRFGESHVRAVDSARVALDRVGAGALAERPVTELSGGERQRVALASLLAQQAPLLLVDEPANHLDPAQQIDAYELLGRLWADGYGILCVTHDVNLLRHVGSPERLRIVGIADGQLRFQLKYSDESLPSALADLFQVEMRSLESGAARLLVAHRRER